MGRPQALTILCPNLVIIGKQVIYTLTVCWWNNSVQYLKSIVYPQSQIISNRKEYVKHEQNLLEYKYETRYTFERRKLYAIYRRPHFKNRCVPYYASVYTSLMSYSTTLPFAILINLDFLFFVICIVLQYKIVLAYRR